MTDKEPKASNNRTISPTAMRILANALDKSGRKNGQPQMIAAGRKMAALAKEGTSEKQFQSPSSAQSEGANKPLRQE